MLRQQNCRSALGMSPKDWIESIVRVLAAQLSAPALRRDERVVELPMITTRTAAAGVKLLYNAGISNHRRFAIFLRVLQLMHEHLVCGTVATKRDIFYEDVGLFGSQLVVDCAIDDIAASYGAPREVFNVLAAPRGLAAANGLQLEFSPWGGGNGNGSGNGGNTIQVLTGNREQLIPNVHALTRVVLAERCDGGGAVVLVVEKEAVFLTLLRHGVAALIPGCKKQVVLVTGRGYPDVNTRRFLAAVRKHCPDVAMHALVDCDPHGMHILQVYRSGSASQGHVCDARGIADMQHAGVTLADMLAAGLDRAVPLTQGDVRKAQSMLAAGVPRDIGRVLQQMLRMHAKAEIEVLGEGVVANIIIQRLSQR